MTNNKQKNDRFYNYHTDHCTYGPEGIHVRVALNKAETLYAVQESKNGTNWKTVDFYNGNSECEALAIGNAEEWFDFVATDGYDANKFLSNLKSSGLED